mmetsp:Transcript_7628/g.47088  ORF Transcript_7628/g.47088 Transcript_7628/m.47088 type:complete len:132 (+) Transcript_7628:804-1199(+)
MRRAAAHQAEPTSTNERKIRGESRRQDGRRWKAKGGGSAEEEDAAANESGRRAEEKEEEKVRRDRRIEESCRRTTRRTDARRTCRFHADRPFSSATETTAESIDLRHATVSSRSPTGVIARRNCPYARRRA